MTPLISPHLKPAGLRARAKRSLIATVWIVGGTYAVWCAALYLLQDSMLFPRSMARAPLAGPGYPGTVEYRVDLASGSAVDAWFIPSDNASGQRPGPVVIFFHGNAELIDFQDDLVGAYQRLGVSVLLPEYRGYGRCGGRPSQHAIGSDMQQFYAMLLERADIDPARIVFHGRSLGGAVAADLATVHPPAAMILQSTFQSVSKMAHRYAAPSVLIKNSYRTDRVIEQADYPVLILHGTHDGIIPVSHGRALRDRVPESLLTYHEFAAGHNDFPGPGNHKSYWNEIRRFLTTHGIIDGE